MNAVKHPKLSVIIPAYNEERVIADCLKSIYAQTFQDFEVVIADDASTDRMPEILNGMKDDRTRVIRHEKNGGPARALLTASQASRGEYITVIGADEQTLPDRFAHQVAFLDAHPDVALVGCQVFAAVDEDNRFVAFLSDYPLIDVELRWMMLFNNPIMTTVAMYRTSVIRKHGIDWDVAYPTAQDYKLFSEIMKVGKAANLSYRGGITRARVGISSRQFNNQSSNRDTIAYDSLTHLGLNEGITKQDWSDLGLIWARRYQRFEHLEPARDKLIRLYMLVAQRYLARHKGDAGLWRVRRTMALDVLRMLVPAITKPFAWKRLIVLFAFWPSYPLDFAWVVIHALYIKIQEKKMRGKRIG